MGQVLTAELSVKNYIEEYRDVQYFIELCKQCRNYGNSWLCPPFQFDAEALLTKWENALIVLCRFDLPAGEHRIEYAMSLLREKRAELEKRLLELERQTGGLCFGFSGECLCCKTCARIIGRQCVHPDKARPALEAYGFNVAKTVKNLFGIKMEWGKNGILPHTLSIVGALFHNCDQGEIIF